MEPLDPGLYTSGGSGQFRKRKMSNAASTSDTPQPGATYNPRNEQFPDKPWYALDYEGIIANTGDLCDKLAIPLQQYATFAQEIEDLVKAAQAAKILPSITKLYLAILGEQGAGKSTLINALLDRQLLHRSAGGRSCTAYATIIIHKEGAPDNTRMSDVIVEFLNDEDLMTCILEQIDRWVEVNPEPYPKQETNSDSDNDGEERDSHPDPHNDTKQSKTTKSSDTLAQERKWSIATAKEFFHIIFNTSKDDEARQRLEKELYTTDISTGNFSYLCFAHAKTLLAESTADHETKDGKSYFTDLSDRDLGKKNTVIRRLWPLVKTVTIATGHILLRHGLVFFDLPGYGDTSQLREAVINSFRRKADFEMVVFPNLRWETSTSHNIYIDRSIHLKGPNKTIMVMNKIDALINEDTIEDQIRDMLEEPFITFAARLDRLDYLEDNDEEDPEYITQLRKALKREAYSAVIDHEVGILQNQMQGKGIKAYAAAPLTYTQWRNRSRENEPLISPQKTGIPTLRQLLFILPSETNFRNYKDHAFRVLPALRKQAGRLIEKHFEDQSYAIMRRLFGDTIPILVNNLGHLAATAIEQFVSRPWTNLEKQDVTDGVKDLKYKWKQPHIYYKGFEKMLRENGIPVNGVYQGRNLNDDVLQSMIVYIDRWNTTMQTRAEQLGDSLNDPVKALLGETELSINRSSAQFALKEQAIDALQDASRAIEMAYNLLLVALKTSLRETHLHFTTEIDIYCPVAREMMPIYRRAQDSRYVQLGRGVYERQRTIILNTILHPLKPDRYHPWIEKLNPLLSTLEGDIVSQLKAAWNIDCQNFINAVTIQLNGFHKTTEDLLMNAAYATQEHEKARALLKSLLVDFDEGLAEIQSRFTGKEVQPAAKRARFSHHESYTQTQDPPSEFHSETALVRRRIAKEPTIHHPGWLRFREPFGGLS